MPKTSKLYERIGQTFGMLTVVGVSHKNPHGEYFAFCDCSCGTRGKVIGWSEIRRGATVSCGCKRRLDGIKRRTKHGLSHLKLYHIWSKIMDRCYNMRSSAYKYYGGRGIDVCERWRSVENFISDLGEKPKGKSLDRVDNDKGYGPENCRWATPKEQALNTRKVRLIEFRGQQRPISHWLNDLGIDPSSFYYRLKKGISPSNILEELSK
jgi:hypothetical protein